MSKIVYIIPGFTEKTSSKSYQRIIKSFKSHNFHVIPIKISWKHKVMSDYVKEFLEQLSHGKNDQIYIFGFSFGAMIAFISATQLKPKMLFLCSLSPYFKEDLKYVKKSWINIVGKKRIDDLKNFSFNQLVKKINCKTFLIIGEKESKEIQNRINDANIKMKNSKLFIVKNTKHDISQKAYTDKLKEIINLKLLMF